MVWGQWFLGRDFWGLVGFLRFTGDAQKQKALTGKSLSQFLVPVGCAHIFFAFGFLRAKATLSLGARAFVRSLVFWGLNSLAILSGNTLCQCSLLSSNTFLVWFGTRILFSGGSNHTFSRGSRFVRILFLGALVTLLCLGAEGFFFFFLL